jgi:hypothetical protein
LERVGASWGVLDVSLGRVGARGCNLYIIL